MPVATFSGLASGIDSSSLIDAIVQAREVQNDIRRADISSLENENDSLDELNTKILALNDLIDQFRTINGGGVKKKASSADSSTVSASPGTGATNGTYTVNTITSLADTAHASFNHSYTSATDVVSPMSGSPVFTVGLGADQVVITTSVTGASTTIQDLVDQINADPNASGRLSASVVNVGTTSSPDYRIALQTLETGTDKGTLAIAAGGVPELLAQTVSQATNAVFTMAGISGSITRDSNTIDNVISGTTLQLSKTSGTAVSLTISNDADSTADLMGQIVDGYNEIVSYINENNNVTRAQSGNTVTNIFGSLAKTRLDDDFLSQFKSSLSTASSTNGTAVTSMSELGISTNRDGSLTFDTDKFKAAIASDSLGVQEVIVGFADTVAGTGGTLYEYTKFAGIIDIAQESNLNIIESMNKAISDRDRTTEKIRSSLVGQFSRLESTVGRLQSQQASLSSALSGL